MYKNLLIESKAHISFQHNQLRVETEDVHHFPIEDLNSLVVSNRASTITVYCLDALAKNGTCVITCGNNYHPTGVQLPFGAYSRRLPMIKLQFNQPRPRVKKLWQQIIKQKILNQGKCLQLSGQEDSISFLADKVKSGDSGNMESVAANKYFKILFGKAFSRQEDDMAGNAMLNYGYAVIRASIARFIAVYGLEPSVGLFHHSEQNNFNLADDLIEPFRPVIDMLVYKLLMDGHNEMSPEVKSQLIETLNIDVEIGSKRQPVNYAIEQVVQSLIRCYKGDDKNLKLPNILPLKVHSYE